MEMKKINIKFWAGLFAMLMIASSCEDALDINENPNSPTTADVELVLPQAIVSSANIASQFNNYGGHFGGYIANAGGFSGFGNLLSYNLTPSDYNGLWVNTYQDPLRDLKYVIDNTEGSDKHAYYNAAAKIMSVVNFQRLVDAFGDIPYSEAFEAETGNTAPAYDNAGDVYQDLFATLNEAIGIIDGAQTAQVMLPAADPLFGDIEDHAAQMLEWKRYANTLKLRILIRLSGKPEFASFVTSGFAALTTTFNPVFKNDPVSGTPTTEILVTGGSAFLSDDAIVDPGYSKNQPNPAWATWGRNTADQLANSSRIPTTFSFTFFNGVKIDDPGRGETIFVNFPSTPTNQLGNEVGNPTIVTGQVTWASNQSGLTGLGVLKGPGMGQPLMLLAEAKFLQAEAIMKGYMAGSDATAFREGIEASFRYLYKDESETVTVSNAALQTMVNDYVGDNAGDRLVDYSLATTAAQKLEAIITQKYIAMLMITSDESYNEYRRTGYPVSVQGGGPALDIASNKSTITARPDRLPTRILYPSSEQSFNSANYVLIDHTSDLMFWDPN
jgi:hypothetical protein